MTPAQQAEADRSRILNHLEGGGRPAPVPREGRRSGRWAVWGGMLAGALLLLATGAWLGQRETAAQAEPALASTAPAPETPAVASAPVTAAASIREEEQALPQQSLSEMLGAGMPAPVSAPVPSPRDVLSQALETPQKSARKAAPPKKPPAKPLKPAAPAKPATTPEQENDVALLAALVSHAQAGTAPKKAAPSLQAQLLQCSKLRPAAADGCRQRTCAGRVDKPLCKAARAAAQGAR
ncbi:hypothetical protein [Janthinobacterium sp. GW458P]|uniref:hypothetical protein n=1 Tax=Janthinobacterium sp. GW458P TaxID=1981504 RepID=UPI0012FD44C6|nr:hypothetical protein [Janthinobacterium sp. GW458P]